MSRHRGTLSRAGASQDLLGELLRSVSRSFYLTLRVLPRPVRRPIGLAYLLARATDTIADAGLVPVSGRLEALRLLGDRIAGRSDRPFQWTPGALDSEGTEGERRLLERIEEGVMLLEGMEEGDRDRIRRVLEVIVSGQTLDLERFGGASFDAPVALASESDLDDYTWRVAGCVGEFWTGLCADHLFRPGEWSEDALREDAVAFGCGLQLVNILRDVGKDLRVGRCYLPADLLAGVGLEPRELADPANADRLRPVLDLLTRRARVLLDGAARYTLTIPYRAVRLRLACAWPLVLGKGTLDLLEEGNPLDASRPVKVPRSEVRRVLRASAVAVWFPGAWRRFVGGDGFSA